MEKIFKLYGSLYEDVFKETTAATTVNKQTWQGQLRVSRIQWFGLRKIITLLTIHTNTCNKDKQIRSGGHYCKFSTCHSQ